MDKQDVKEVAKKALEFTRTYYKSLDNPTVRPSLLDVYLDVPNLCEWNGHSYPTKEHIHGYLSGLPKTSHQIDVVDAQPLPGNIGGPSGDFTFLTTVHGVVTYDDEHKREFYQRFVVRLVNHKCYIANDYFRWLSEKQ